MQHHKSANHHLQETWIKAATIAERHGDNHPFQVAYHGIFDDVVVALLHDSLEDGYSTVSELKEKRFDKATIDDVITLTRNKDETYVDYIKRIKKAGGRPLRVKLVDVKLNYYRSVATRHKSLVKRYRRALETLQA